MGHITHNAIVVTGWNADKAKLAQDEAVRIGLTTTPIVVSSVNAYGSFLVVPDGSKLGWPDDMKGDAMRDSFIDWLRSVGRTFYLEWCEIEYGNDDGTAAVVRHAWPTTEGESDG